MPARGYIVLLTQARFEELQEYVERDYFAEPVPYFSCQRGTKLITFIFSRNKLTYIAVGKKGNSAGTGLVRLNLSNFISIVASIPASRILNEISGQVRTGIQNRIEQGGELTQNGLQKLIEIISEHDMGASDFLNQFRDESRIRFERLTSEVKYSLGFQKEAIMSAVHMAGLSREQITQWTTPQNTMSCFLDGLSTPRLHEDQMIIYDGVKFPGCEFVRTVNNCGILLESNDSKLTVIVANKLPLERLTGADLIYYNETYNSFIFVQYKAMNKEGDTSVYRPDDQLAAEIIRMDGLLLGLVSSEEDHSCDAFRLNTIPFFMKICPRIQFDPTSEELVKGMYIHIDHWKRLMASPVTDGARGAKTITFENVKRYFSNTEFSSLVMKSWIGSTPSHSSYLKDIIKETLESGRAIVIAAKQQSGLSEEADWD